MGYTRRSNHSPDLNSSKPSTVLESQIIFFTLNAQRNEINDKIQYDELTANIQAADFVFHGIRVDLAHVTILVGHFQMPYVQVPRAVDVFLVAGAGLTASGHPKSATGRGYYGTAGAGLV